VAQTAVTAAPLSATRNIYQLLIFTLFTLLLSKTISGNSSHFQGQSSLISPLRGAGRVDFSPLLPVTFASVIPLLLTKTGQITAQITRVLTVRLPGIGQVLVILKWSLNLTESLAV
jgi:hypothetical protein